MLKKLSIWDKLVVFVVVVNVLLRFFLLHPTFSDETFYFNVAKNIVEGKIPYIDFFFAHPPLQVYLLSIFYRFFGNSFILGKILTTIVSSTCILLLYLIIKQIHKGKSAFFTSLLFIVSPPFLAFSSISYGMWESMLFLLLSLLLVFKRNTLLASIFFTLAIFFRYIAVFYLPLFLVALYFKREKFSNFFLLFFILLFSSFFLLVRVFGTNYIIQTIIYHLSKPRFSTQTQYLGMGTFFIFLALISILIGYFEKDKLMIAFAILPLLIDLSLLLSLQMVFYHYFLLSLPFYLIAFSRVFELKYDFVKVATLVLLLISLMYNFKTLDFYLNPKYSQKFYKIASFVSNYTKKDDVIFGEPVMTNYVAFVTNRGIAGNYLDTYIQHLIFEGSKNVVKTLKEEKPKIIIEMGNYYSSLPEFNIMLHNNYTLIKHFGGAPKYLIYKFKD